jgi:hypothetical protein
LLFGFVVSEKESISSIHQNPLYFYRRFAKFVSFFRTFKSKYKNIETIVINHA